jgi:hypothetical protein
MGKMLNVLSAMDTFAAVDWTRVRALRDEAAVIGENVADMVSTQLRIADRDGWDDPRIAAIERDIEAATETRLRLLRNANALATGRSA